MVWLLLLMGWAMLAPAHYLPIDADNVTYLRPVLQVEFARLGAFRSGWFALSADGNYLAVASTDGRVLVLQEGEVVGAYQRGTLHDAVFDGERLLAVHSDADGTLELLAYDWQHDALDLLYRHDFADTVPDLPIALWADAQAVYVEMLSRDFSRSDYLLRWTWNAENAEVLPYVIATDPDAVVRVGRVPLPYVVTSSVDGVVKLWDLAQGVTLAEVDNRLGIAATFGNINAAATHFAWRDNFSEQLYLLDWETGENRALAPLGGAYAQWYFLSADADVVLAVNLDGQPVVVAWAVKTGEKRVLGQHLACSRPQPDHARLSADGSTLAIGCDSGVQLWRIVLP